MLYLIIGAVVLAAIAAGQALMLSKVRAIHRRGERLHLAAAPDCVECGRPYPCSTAIAAAGGTA